MIFYALTSAGPRARCWNPSLKGESFNTSWGAQQMQMYQKSMFDRYYCKKTFFSLENFGETASKSLFTCTYNGAEKHITCKCFENAATRAKTNVITTVYFTDDDVSFYDGPRMLIRTNVKPQSHASTLLIHGFLLVKTWLLITCPTAFYAIINVFWQNFAAALILTTSSLGLLNVHFRQFVTELRPLNDIRISLPLSILRRNKCILIKICVIIDTDNI